MDEVLQEVRALGNQVGRTGPGTRSRRDKIAAAAKYLENHREYLTCSTVGEIIMGTGIVEGTIKQIGARLKGPGMRWSVERAERMLALRCLQLSDDGAWERFVGRVREDYEAVSSLHVPPISTEEVVTGHSAAKKAA